MSKIYSHQLNAPASEYIRYRGQSNQIDVQASIINIVAKKPGLSSYEIYELIYPKPFDNEAYKFSDSHFYKTLISLCTKEVLVQADGDQYFTWDDAWSHDVAKTKDVIDVLNKMGLSTEFANQIASAVVMAGEEHLAKVEGRQYNPMDSHASSFFTKKEAPVEVKVESESPCEAVTETYILTREVHDPELESFLKSQPEPENDEMVDPFANMVKGDFEALQEHAMSMFREEDAQEQAERIRVEERELIEMAEKVAEEARIKLAEDLRKEKEEYKRTINNINDGVSLLGKKVQFLNVHGEPGNETIATILELKPDGILFLVLFSNDNTFIEGEVVNILYSQQLRYKIVL